LRVAITPGLKPSRVSYSIDGSEPDPSKRTGTAKITINETTTVKAVLLVDGKKVGNTAEVTYRKRTPPAAGEAVAFGTLSEPTTLETVLPLLAKGEAVRGRAVFQAAGCVACHKVGAEGGAFGPDLSGLGERANPEQLIRSILEPNADITEGFALLAVSTRDGKAFAGRRQEETATILTLMQPDGTTVPIKRAEIAKQESLHTSPMPPFDRVLSPQQVADMVAWLSARDAARPSTGAMPAPTSSPARGFAAEMRDDNLVITDGGQPVATYVFKDAQTLRPHLRNLFAPGGARVTRNHPPAADEPSDHATMHPGVWFAFGSINGEDFWRNKARIEHERFIEPPSVKDDRLTFATTNRLITAAGQALAVQLLRVSIARRTDSYLVTCETTLRSDTHDLVFGEQEEMGFGIRLATPLIEKNGGKIVNGEGRISAKQTWGQVSDYCSYWHVINDRAIGAAIFTVPTNPQRSWWHTRDYGLMVANPFGKRVLPAGSDGNLSVKRGDALTMRFGLLLFNAPGGVPNIPGFYREFAGTPVNAP
jgi:putative heme-binding domain-containing protein